MSTTQVLDDAALHRLGEQLGDSDILCGFLRRYLALLDARIARLERALRAEDQDDWMDAVLSLKTSSSLVGAQALAERAAELQQEFAACPSWCAPPESTAHATPAPGASGASTAGPATTGSEIARRTERMACLRRLAAETARQLRVFLQQASGTSHPGRVSPT